MQGGFVMATITSSAYSPILCAMSLTYMLEIWARVLMASARGSITRENISGDRGQP